MGIQFNSTTWMGKTIVTKMKFALAVMSVGAVASAEAYYGGYGYGGYGYGGLGYGYGKRSADADAYYGAYGLGYGGYGYGGLATAMARGLLMLMLTMAAMA